MLRLPELSMAKVYEKQFLLWDQFRKRKCGNSANKRVQIVVIDKVACKLRLLSNLLELSAVLRNPDV